MASLTLCSENTMKSLLWFVALSLIVLSIVWISGALKAGLFIQDAQGIAPRIDENAIEAFSRDKKFVDVAGWRVAYIDRGSGEPVVLLHGCPFQSFEYSKVIPSLARHYRAIAPDLLGLGDTIVRLDDDYRLPNQVRMVVGLLDQLGIRRAHFVGHDHGGAVVQLMMNSHADRLGAVVLTNVEAYDQWPSDPERLDVELIVHPLSTSFFRLAFGVPAVQRRVLSIAVHRSEVLTQDVIRGLMRSSMATPARWKRLRRFLAWQLDRDHSLETMRAVDSLRRFDHPTLLLWGRHDSNFGPAIAERLAHDIPGVVGIEWLTNSAHLPMLEEPETYANAIERFLANASMMNRTTDATSTVGGGQ
jgi:2-hydroxymuconate-semialdehyde hydrolase